VDVGGKLNLAEVQDGQSEARRESREYKETSELTGRGRYSDGDLIRGTEAAAAY
jgi:hypothetical protein